MRKLLKKFVQNLEGSVTIETLLWVPVYYVLVGLVVDATSIAMTQARFQGIAADAARMMALGQFNETEALTYIDSRAFSFEYFDAEISTVDDIVSASITMSFANVFGLNILTRGDGVFGASAHFLAEDCAC